MKERQREIVRLARELGRCIVTAVGFSDRESDELAIAHIYSAHGILDSIVGLLKSSDTVPSGPP